MKISSVEEAVEIFINLLLVLMIALQAGGAFSLVEQVGTPTVRFPGHKRNCNWRILKTICKPSKTNFLVFLLPVLRSTNYFFLNAYHRVCRSTTRVGSLLLEY